MKINQKYIVGLFTVLMGVSLVACGGSEVGGQVDNDSPNNTNHEIRSFIPTRAKCDKQLSLCISHCRSNFEDNVDAHVGCLSSCRFSYQQCLDKAWWLAEDDKEEGDDLSFDPME